MIYTIEKETLTALGDAIRDKGIVPQYRDETIDYEKYKSPNAPSYDNATPTSSVCESSYLYEVNIPEATTLRIDYTIGVFTDDTYPGGAGGDFHIGVLDYDTKYKSHYIQNPSAAGDYSVNIPANNCRIKVKNYQNKGISFGATAKIYPFDANGNPMQLTRPTKFNTLTPMQMAEAIESAEMKVPVKPIELTGDCQYGCAGAVASAYIEANGDTITTKDITNASYMFQYSTLETIPFELNFKQCSGAYEATAITGIFSYTPNLKYIPDFDVKHANYYADCRNVFNACNSLLQLPYIYNLYPSDLSYLFNSCFNLREIPDDYFDTWNLSRMNSYQYANVYNIFGSCRSLRSLSPKLLSKLIGNETVNKGSSGIAYGAMCSACYALDELIDVPIAACELTSNSFGSIVNNCCRLKNFTFETNEDGSPKTAKWKNQTLELSPSVGIAGSAAYITSYNSGITADKEVKDDATYQALKNDPDWFTTQRKYSRFNHDSAVATINSLPDTSAYGTNTVKFLGPSGGSTDGGEISNLTAEEIAVAAAKGWTVTLTV